MFKIINCSNMNIRYEVIMNKILAISLVLLSFTLAGGYVEAASYKVVKTTPAYNNSTYNAYSNDLNHIESYLFNRTYRNENVNTRLNRIEKQLFNRSYSSMTTAQRMNNVLANYRDDYNNRNYLSNYYNNPTPRSRINNRIFGQPTGFTPQIINTPFGDNPYMTPGFSRGYTNNRGYGYRNVIPATSRAGITILD